MTNEERDQALEQRVIWNLIAKVTLTLFSTFVCSIFQKSKEQYQSSIVEKDYVKRWTPLFAAIKTGSVPNLSADKYRRNLYLPQREGRLR
jgi:hypothetical protein